jgi:hypothetical protein
VNQIPGRAEHLAQAAIGRRGPQQVQSVAGEPRAAHLGSSSTVRCLPVLSSHALATTMRGFSCNSGELAPTRVDVRHASTDSTVAASETSTLA